jgi:hypothetical protein
MRAFVDPMKGREKRTLFFPIIQTRPDFANEFSASVD